MLFKEFEQKLSYLANFEDSQLIEELSLQIQIALQRNSNESSIPIGVSRSIKLDLIYAIVRHISWFKVPLFFDIVIEFLKQEFKLPHLFCEELIEAVITSLNKHIFQTPPHNELFTDKDFLRYIFIYCATADDESTLIADLGLGTSLLKRIKLAAESVMTEADPESDKIHFLPEIDALFSEIMLEISDDLKNIPWAMDIYRLYYHLATSPYATDDTINIELSEKIFKFLLHLGKDKNTTSTIFIEAYKQTFLDSTNDNFIDSEDISRLKELLEKKELIYLCQSSKDINKNRWSLSKLGQKITADCYAIKLLDNDFSDYSKIPTLYPHYQAAIIKRIPEQNEKELLDLLKAHTRSLAPTTVLAIVKRLSLSIKHEIILETLYPFLNSSTTPWLKASICQCLTFLHTAIKTKAILKEVRQNDNSQITKRAAHNALKQLSLIEI